MDVTAQIFCRDAVKFVKTLQDESVDLVLTSPPYFIGKEYDSSTDVRDFANLHAHVLPEIIRALKPGGSIAWQTGYHISQGYCMPLDYIVFEIISKFEEIKLQNRIIWQYGHGLHASNKFSGRHEVVMWFTKDSGASSLHKFNLDAVRVPQKYPGKRHYKGLKKGSLSGNPLGKNPSDVWQIPNVKAKHVEKTEHPCQFPTALAERIILATTSKGDLVYDPFCGVGTTSIASLMHGRSSIGTDTNPSYCTIARERIELARKGRLKTRPLAKPVMQPNPSSKVATKPTHFQN